MKKIKTILPILAVIMLMTAAFTTKSKAGNTKKLTTYFYQYSGTTTDLNDYRNADNWSSTLSTNPGTCSGSSSVPCIVQSTLADKADFMNDIQNNGASVVDNNVADYKP